MPAVVDREKCEGCGDCVEVCPTESIQVDGTLAVVKEEECIDCNACVDACIRFAVEIDG